MHVNRNQSYNGGVRGSVSFCVRVCVCVTSACVGVGWCVGDTVIFLWVLTRYLGDDRVGSYFILLL